VNAIASPRRDLPETLQNIPAELPGVVCEQSVRRGNKQHVYYARFWREDGQLRKQYVRKADVEAVRAACAARREREGERIKTCALMVAAFGAAAVSEQRRQVNAMIRDAVGDNMTANQLRKVLYRR